MYRPKIENPTVVRVDGLDNVELFIHRVISVDLFEEWLKEFNADFRKNRGADPSYKFAQLLRSSMFDADTFALDKNCLYGWEVLKQGNIEDSSHDYMYILEKDGSVSEM